ncbi:hypothetical protein ACNKHV_08200 [Shigella flexneri]
MLPFHLFSNGTVARSFCVIAGATCRGAQEKAEPQRWQGALFPWESARSGEERAAGICRH